MRPSGCTPSNYERVRPALDAYTRARKIILNHGKGGTLVDSE